MWKGWGQFIDEEWKDVSYVQLGDDIYEYETENKRIIEDFAEFNPIICKWLPEHRNDDILLTIKVHPETEVAMYAIGIWKIDVDEDIDNRVYFESDYEQVIEWLEKRAKEEKRIKTGKSEEP